MGGRNATRVVDWRAGLTAVLALVLAAGCASEADDGGPAGAAGPAPAAVPGAEPGAAGSPAAPVAPTEPPVGATPTGGAAGAAADPVTAMMAGEAPDMGDIMEMGVETTGTTLGGSDDPTEDCEGFFLDEGTFTVNPGEDVNYCVRIAIPAEFRDRDLVLRGWNWDLSTTHHYFMEHSPNPYDGADPAPCNTDGTQNSFSLLGSANDEGSTIAFGAGEGQGWTMLKEGYGKFLPANGHFRTSHHVINFTDQPIEIGARFKVCASPAESIPHPMNSLVCTTTAINVPGASGSATSTCTAIEPIDVMLLASHGHQHLTRFTIQFYDGRSTQDPILYESTDWDSPEILALEEPLHLERGQGLTYTCHYEGTGPVRFEDNARSPEGEHCALFTAYAYPPDRPNETPPRVFNVGIFPNQVSPVALSIPGSPI